MKKLPWLREPWVLLLVFTIFGALALLVLYPLAQVFWESVHSEEHGKALFSLSHFAASFLKPYHRAALFNSLLLATLTATLGTLLAFAFAFSLTRARVPFQPLFKALAILPIISPPFVVALSCILLFGRNGLLTRHFLLRYFGLDLHALGFSVYGLGGLLLVQVVSLAPTGFLLLTGPLQSLDPSLEESALTLGASQREVFRKVTLPLLFPSLFSAFLLLFIESLADFGTPLILSGRVPILSVQAYLEITGNDNQAGGAALALLLLLPSVVIYFVNLYLVEKWASSTLTGKPTGSPFQFTGRGLKLFLAALLSLYSLSIALLYGLIAVGAFTKLWGLDYHFTLQNFPRALALGGDSLRNSLLIALIASPLTGLLGAVIAYLVERKRFPGRQLLELLSMLTFAVPGTVVGIGYVLAFNRPPLLLQGTLLILVLLLIFRNLPVGVRAGSVLLKSFGGDLEEAAQTLGASSGQIFSRLYLPLMAPALFSGMAYSFARCMTSISAVIFVVSGRWNLLTISILGFVENADFSEAAALSLILVGAVFAALFLMERALLFLFRTPRVDFEPMVV